MAACEVGTAPGLFASSSTAQEALTETITPLTKHRAGDLITANLQQPVVGERGSCYRRCGTAGTPSSVLQCPLPAVLIASTAPLHPRYCHMYGGLREKAPGRRGRRPGALGLFCQWRDPKTCIFLANVVQGRELESD